MTKNKLLRDGQIVGYERIRPLLTERSYDNQRWVPDLEIPYTEKKQFLNFDEDTLAEVYED